MESERGIWSASAGTSCHHLRTHSLGPCQPLPAAQDSFPQVSAVQSCSPALTSAPPQAGARKEGRERNTLEHEGLSLASRGDFSKEHVLIS